MNSSTSLSVRRSKSKPGEPVYTYPNEHAVTGWRNCFRVFVSPPNNFRPYDVLGVLFWSRLEFCGDFMPRGVPQTVEVRAKALVPAIKFWLAHLEPEMLQAGLALRLSFPAKEQLAHALCGLNDFLVGVLFPSMDGAVRAGLPIERARAVMGMWHWARDQAVKAGKISREDLLGGVRAALLSGGMTPGNSDEETIAMLQSLRKTWGPNAITVFTDKRTGRWRVGVRQLRDATPLLRKGRRMRAKKREGEKRTVSLDRPFRPGGDESLATTIASMAASPEAELLASIQAGGDVRAVEALRQVCDARRKRPIARKDARARALARENLFALATRQLTQAQVRAGVTIDKGNLSKAFRSELGWALKETRRQLAGG